jgi:enoyl-CoA hydratase/carnithine racemase
MGSPVTLGTRLSFDAAVLDSPGNRNALSLQLMGDLRDAVRTSATSASRGLVLTHVGPSFCSGVDMKERRAVPRTDTTHSELLADLLRELWSYPKPLVVVVDGAVRGGGLGVLACADVVLATSRSTFAYSEARVGVAPALVMAVTLPLSDTRRLMPHLLGAGLFDAAVASSLGIVTSVLPERDDAAVDAVLDGVRRGAPAALATIKRLARASTADDVARRITEMTALSAKLFASDEAAEGMTAFAEHRQPSWAVPVPSAGPSASPSTGRTAS